MDIWCPNRDSDRIWKLQMSEWQEPQSLTEEEAREPDWAGWEGPEDYPTVCAAPCLLCGWQFWKAIMIHHPLEPTQRVEQHSSMRQVVVLSLAPLSPYLR
jgi:hypothetical protein